MAMYWARQIELVLLNFLMICKKHAHTWQGAAWAEQYKKDLEALAAYDAQVASDPVNGPKIAA